MLNLQYEHYLCFFADHIAVHLFLCNEVSRLLLHFPAKWIQKPKPHFEDNGKSDQNNPGKMANIYHRHFSKTTGIDSLMQIQQAIQIGAYFKVHNGFQERNKHVAMSNKLIAFTWGEGDKPKPGGTLNTWRLCKGRRIHVPYASLTCICATVMKASRETGEKRKLMKTSDCLSTRPSKVTLNDAEDDNEKYVKEFEGFDMFSDLIDTN